MRMQTAPKRLTRAEQKARTRDRLLAAARRVIARRGLGAASVDEISEHAGYSSGAFYSNFESKDEVFAAALEYHSQELERFLSEGNADGLSRESAWLGQLDDWQVLFWLEIVAQGGRSPGLRPAVRRHLAANRQRLAKALEESGRTASLDTDGLAALVLAAEIGLFVQRLFDKDLAEELLDGLVDRLLNEP
jgi:AcrR family transcriptional regulator